MGVTQSHPEYIRSLELFTKHEQEQMTKIFVDIANVPNDPHPVSFDREKLQAYLDKKLPTHMITQLHNLMSNVLVPKDAKTHHTHVSREPFVVTLAYLLKGSLTQRSELILGLATKNPAATSMEIFVIMQELLETYLKLMMETEQFSTWSLSQSKESTHNYTRFLLKDLYSRGVSGDQSPTTPDDEETFNEFDIEHWLSQSAFITHLMDYIFYNCFPVSFIEDATAVLHKPKIPICTGIDWSKTTTMLDLTSLIFLNHSIPADLGTKWRLLYNSKKHGESFSTMVKYISKQGPTILMIKDADDHIFGGFATDSWEIKPEWSGTSRCFLYTLQPNISRYFPSGYNNHFMYLNQGQQTMPNGLGFGGQLNYFGLWLDHDYGKGQCKAEPKCTTFNSPQLSGKADFKFNDIEVWGVGPAPNETDTSLTSVLDKDPEAMALLSLSGRKMASEGLRETDATAESPEDHELPAL